MKFEIVESEKKEPSASPTKVWLIDRGDGSISLMASKDDTGPNFILRILSEGTIFRNQGVSNRLGFLVDGYGRVKDITGDC